MVEKLPRRKYSWNKWSHDLPEGRAWVAYRFKDYHCKDESFGSQLRKLAAENGKKATIMVFEGCVVFAFFDADSFWKPNMPALKDVQKALRKHDRPRRD